jgi:bifunctional non-homologous end joining protein LigD
VTEVELKGRRLRLSSLDKVLWPRAGWTKADLVDYYRAVSPVLLPHLRRRPLTLGRFPDGVEERGWYQTNCRGHPDWMATQELVGRRGQLQRLCVVDDVASLVWVANQGTIELHPFLAAAEAPDHPLALVFDLDPGPPADVAACCDVAIRLREALAADGLAAFPKTSGGVGLHVYAPLDGTATFARTKAYARGLAGRLEEETPDLVTSRSRRDLRVGRVLVDWLQNDPTRSTVAPYSLRAAPFPVVAAPVTWDEVEATARTRRAESLTFLARDVLRRVAEHGDLFERVLLRRQRLPV